MDLSHLKVCCRAAITRHLGTMPASVDQDEIQCSTCGTTLVYLKEPPDQLIPLSLN